MSKKIKNQEKVLTISKNVLYPHGAHHGLRADRLSEALKTILNHAQFLPRFAVEEDSSTKQIIPYLIFSYKNKFFLMQRRGDHTEARLANQFFLGIGGHIRQEEFGDEDIFSWAKREFEEEVAYNGKIKSKAIGLLNDESNSVGQVHSGLVILLEGDSSEISAKDELKSGELKTLKECEQVYDQMENWSKIVFDFLKNNG